MQTITVFRGDGIGPEITDAVLEILDAAGAQFNYEIFDVGEAVYQKPVNSFLKKVLILLTKRRYC